MALYGIGDLHLSSTGEKSMDVFEGWHNYRERLKINWRNRVKDDDMVVIPGDFSWASSIEDAVVDFAFINELPGKKVIIKGNHDYWWSTATKINGFLGNNSFTTINIINNNSITYNDVSIAGTRGWVLERDSIESMKVYLRETNRLRLSLEDASGKKNKEIIAFLHYPPVYANYRQTEIIDLLKEFNIKRCYYGHVHGTSFKYSVNGERDGITYKLISADYLKFSPHLIEN